MTSVRLAGHSGMTTLSDVLQPHVDRGAIPGAVALVARGDDVEVATVGTAAVGGDDPMRRDAIVRIASITKPIAAAVAMSLVEDGTFDLDDAVNRYAFARMILDRGGPVLAEDSVRLMLTDHTTAEQRAASALFLEGEGWGFGGSVDVASVDPWNVEGRYGWVGGTGTAAHVVPTSGIVTILLTQVELTSPTAPPVMRDFWTYAAGFADSDG